MKSDTKSRYVIAFWLFAILLVCISLLFIFLSSRLINPTDKAQVSNTQKDIPIVIIDAGHGGEDGGAIGVNGAFEKDINLSIARKMEVLLSSKGIDCVMTRSEDILLYDRTQDYQGRKKLLDMQARKKIVESYENSLKTNG